VSHDRCMQRFSAAETWCAFCKAYDGLLAELSRRAYASDTDKRLGRGDDDLTDRRAGDVFSRHSQGFWVHYYSRHGEIVREWYQGAKASRSKLEHAADFVKQEAEETARENRDQPQRPIVPANGERYPQRR
jgi:hypothetical protein